MNVAVLRLCIGQIKAQTSPPPAPGHLQAFEFLKISVLKILHYLSQKSCS